MSNEDYTNVFKKFAKKSGKDSGEPMNENSASTTLAYIPKRRKQLRLSETHTSQAYYIQKDILAVMNDIVDDEWGGKYRFVNEALKHYISTYHTEHSTRIQNLED